MWWVELIDHVPAEITSWIHAVECHTHAHTQILTAEQSDWAKILALAQLLCGELTRPATPGVASETIYWSGLKCRQRLKERLAVAFKFMANSLCVIIFSWGSRSQTFEVKK